MYFSRTPHGKTRPSAKLSGKEVWINGLVPHVGTPPWFPPSTSNFMSDPSERIFVPTVPTAAGEALSKNNHTFLCCGCMKSHVCGLLWSVVLDVPSQHGGKTFIFELCSTSAVHSAVRVTNWKHSDQVSPPSLRRGSMLIQHLWKLSLLGLKPVLDRSFAVDAASCSGKFRIEPRLGVLQNISNHL